MWNCLLERVTRATSFAVLKMLLKTCLLKIAIQDSRCCIAHLNGTASMDAFENIHYYYYYYYGTWKNLLSHKAPEIRVESTTNHTINMCYDV